MSNRFDHDIGFLAPFVLLALVLAVIAAEAHATDIKVPPPPPTAEANASASAVASPVVNTQAAASLDLTVGGDTLQLQDRRQAPASFAPAIAPTAPCYYSVGGALSIPGGSIGGGKALLDKGCQLREEIRLAYQLGLVAEADYLFCSGPGKDIPGCGQRARAAPPEPQPTVVVITGESCGGKDRERAERIIERCVGK